MIGSARPMPGDTRCGLARERRDDDRLRGEHLGDVARGIGDRVTDRRERLLGGAGKLVPVAETGLDGLRDSIHREDALDRVAPRRRLSGKHHCRRAVEYCVRDVRRLGPRRLRPGQHRLEHLRRRDRRPPVLERRQDDLLLDERNLLGADLDAQVAAGDHHGIGGLDDRTHLAERLGLLDLGDDARRGPEGPEPLA